MGWGLLRRWLMTSHEHDSQSRWGRRLPSYEMRMVCAILVNIDYGEVSLSSFRLTRGWCCGKTAEK